jgi:GMP synthase-like glutamine amidotransferase
MIACLVAVIVFDNHCSRGITTALARLKVNYKLVLPSEVPSWNPTHVILAEGTEVPTWVINSKIPVLGIGSGMVSIAKLLRGMTRKLSNSEHGTIEVTEILDNIQITKDRSFNRTERVISLPSTIRVVGVTTKDDIAFFFHERWWGIQYHPESSKYGDLQIFRRFLSCT